MNHRTLACLVVIAGLIGLALLAGVVRPDSTSPAIRDYFALPNVGATR